MHRIEVSFDREVSGDTLGRLPGIIGANRTGDKWQVTAEDRDTAIRSLVTYSQQNKVAIVTLNTLAPSLDDAFLRLTQEAEP